MPLGGLAVVKPSPDKEAKNKRHAATERLHSLLSQNPNQNTLNNITDHNVYDVMSEALKSLPLIEALTNAKHTIRATEKLNINNITISLTT